MKPVFQTRFGTNGNCWPAVLASLFEVTLAEVDILSNHKPDWKKLTWKFLAYHDCYFIQVSRDRDGNWPFNAFPDGSLVVLGVSTTLSDLPHVVIGRSKTVIKDNKEGLAFDIVHDPNPNGGPLTITDIHAAIFFPKIIHYR